MPTCEFQGTPFRLHVSPRYHFYNKTEYYAALFRNLGLGGWGAMFQSARLWMEPGSNTPLSSLSPRPQRTDVNLTSNGTKKGLSVRPRSGPGDGISWPGLLPFHLQALGSSAVTAAQKGVSGCGARRWPDFLERTTVPGLSSTHLHPHLYIKEVVGNTLYLSDLMWLHFCQE